MLFSCCFDDKVGNVCVLYKSAPLPPGKPENELLKTVGKGVAFSFSFFCKVGNNCLFFGVFAVKVGEECRKNAGSEPTSVLQVGVIKEVKFWSSVLQLGGIKSAGSEPRERREAGRPRERSAERESGSRRPT